MDRPDARHVLPSFTERGSHGTRIVDPWSKLFEERIVLLGTPLDDEAANALIAQFMHLEHAAPDRDISLYINCPGGSLTAMTAVYDTLRFTGCDVQTVCLGQAASAAAVLLAAGTPGKRLMLPGSRALVHQPSLTEPVRGTTEDLRIRAGELRRLRDLVEELLVRHTGQPRARVAADIERDTFFTAEAAVDYGLADTVAHPREQPRRAAGRD
ncbi:ATP-dependent Clp protease proteolytic subunit [Streptomyces lycii]|uniref:ATP-dependent Clp protease proteolytic subunit n=1 Tax=Streptomyces lycii TaxID=2654337 RepID=A0ABQ7FNQ8_9ACTN|nr:ATP-dependent Clp protease proteolytic subunit [Streptomyces lycii]KAF4410475.1 ATP-dependent Clp protease proteolytic subunit [Streptomyces lycii]